MQLGRALLLSEGMCAVSLTSELAHCHFDLSLFFFPRAVEGSRAKDSLALCEIENAPANIAITAAANRFTVREMAVFFCVACQISGGR